MSTAVGVVCCDVTLMYVEVLRPPIPSELQRGEKVGGVRLGAPKGKALVEDGEGNRKLECSLPCFRGHSLVLGNLLCPDRQFLSPFPSLLLAVCTLSKSQSVPSVLRGLKTPVKLRFFALPPVDFTSVTIRAQRRHLSLLAGR